MPQTCPLLLRTLSVLTLCALHFSGAAFAQSPIPASTIVVKTKQAQQLVTPPAPARPLPQMAPGALRIPTPLPLPMAQPVLIATAPAPAASVLPWVTLTASAVAGVAGTIFMKRSLTALNEDIEVTVKNQGTSTTLSLPQEFRDQQARVLTNGILGTVLLSSAVAGSIASLIGLAGQ